MNDRISELKKVINDIYNYLNQNNNFIDIKETLDKYHIIPNMHIGKSDQMKGNTDKSKIMIMEWYLGSLYGIIEENALFAVNSWLNTKEKFCDKM